jgi:hypothetical protein
MTRLIISMKHWVLFLLLVAPSLIIVILMEPEQSPQWKIVANIISSLVYFYWLWSINRTLSNEPTAGPDAPFKFFFIVVVIYFLCYNSLGLFGLIQDIQYVWIFNLIIFSLTVYCLLTTARRLKSSEMSRPAAVGEYLGYFLLFLVFPIGVWVLQPKINKL